MENRGYVIMAPGFLNIKAYSTNVHTFDYVGSNFQGCLISSWVVQTVFGELVTIGSSSFGVISLESVGFALPEVGELVRHYRYLNWKKKKLEQDPVPSYILYVKLSSTTTGTT